MREHTDAYLDKVIAKLTELRNKSRYTTTTLDFAMMDLNVDIQKQLFKRHVIDECLTYISGLELNELTNDYINLIYNFGEVKRSYTIKIYNYKQDTFEQRLNCQASYTFGYTREDIKEILDSGFMTHDEFIASLKTNQFKISSTLKTLIMRIVDDIDFCEKDLKKVSK